MSNSKQPDQRDQDLQQLMAPLYREEAEPTDGFEPVPTWALVLFGLLLFWGGWYVATNSGSYRGDILDRGDRQIATEHYPRNQAELAQLGGKLYRTHCQVCHKDNGLGLTGFHPPLDQSEWVVGENGTDARLIRILLHGAHQEMKVKDVAYKGVMPAYGATLKDDEIAAILTYIRTTWGNRGNPIWPADVLATRRAQIGRAYDGTSPYTAAELMTIAQPSDRSSSK